MGKAPKTTSAYEKKIQAQADLIARARARMLELDRFIEQHGTIGTDESSAAIRDQYREYESLVKECEDARHVIEGIVAECREKTGATWTVTFNKDFTFEIDK